MTGFSFFFAPFAYSALDTTAVNPGPVITVRAAYMIITCAARRRRTTATVEATVSSEPLRRRRRRRRPPPRASLYARVYRNTFPVRVFLMCTHTHTLARRLWRISLFSDVSTSSPQRPASTRSAIHVGSSAPSSLSSSIQSFVSTCTPSGCEQ